MAELVAGAFLSSSLQVAFERLASHDFLNHFRHTKLDKDLLKKLRVVLLSADEIIENAEERQYGDRRVKKWLDELKDEVFKAQDLLDDIAIEASRQKPEDELRNAIMDKIRGCFSAPVNRNKFDKMIESRIQKLLSNLDNLVQKNNILRLREGLSASIQSGVNRNVCGRVPTTILIDEANVYGRDTDKEFIVGKLLPKNMEGNQLHEDVIAIHGMGGMGKTTLARLVYNDTRIKDQFQHRAWVCVSEEFDVDRVTKAILHSLNCSTDQLGDIHSLQLRLNEKLTGKKLFLVLDDVWNENRAIWEFFQAPLKHVAPQSKILMTTRNTMVAKVMCCAFTHSLKPLEVGDCWSLFAKHAFKNQSDATDEGLLKIGREIVNKCEGLPLAIKTLGSLLHGELSIQNWEKILKSDVWQLSQNDSNIIPSLRLSYHYLPSDMKRCFAYCSIFAKDYDIDKNLLIQLWMADDLIYPTHKSMSLEEAGNEIFNVLRSRSFFEPSQRGGDYFIMHDLLNDLAKTVAGEFFVRLEVGQAIDEGMSSMTRYFSYTSDRNECHETLENVFKCHQLRSFLLLKNYRLSTSIYDDIISRLSHLKYIRELSLSGYRVKIITDDIGNLRHLRYLDLSTTLIEELPNSMCLLINLQTLKLNGCKHLVELPSNFCKLINLRHLNLLDCDIKKMPKHMRKLTQLRTMNQFVVAREGGSYIKELGALKHLTGSLIITHTECITNAADAKKANLKEKQLDRLKLEYKSDMFKVDNYSREEIQQQEQILEALQPNHHLSHLSVKYYDGTKFPKWDMLPSLHHLNLTCCSKMIWIPHGGVFSNLQSLLIDCCANPIASGEAWRFNELLSLKELSIFNCNMHSFAEDGLWPPKLQSISFSCCDILSSIDHRGLVLLHSLTSLSFLNCRRMSFENMPEDGLPSSLSHLSIGPGCPLLKERCKKEEGPDWPKIAHIRRVHV